MILLPIYIVRSISRLLPLFEMNPLNKLLVIFSPHLLLNVGLSFLFDMKNKKLFFGQAKVLPPQRDKLKCASWTNPSKYRSVRVVIKQLQKTMILPWYQASFVENNFKILQEIFIVPIQLKKTFVIRLLNIRFSFFFCSFFFKDYLIAFII